MTGILNNLDKDIREKNVKVLSNILKLNTSKTEAIVSAMLTMMSSLEVSDDKEEDQEEMMTEPTVDTKASMKKKSTQVSPGVQASSAYNL